MIRIITEDSFESLIMSNPTWQQVNRICNEYGYKLDPYARVEVYRSGKRSLENVDITPKTLDETLPEIVVTGDNEISVTLNETPIYESSILEYTAYVKVLQDVEKMLEDLKGIDFYTLHNEPLGE
jgi:hypothetical protein